MKVKLFCLSGLICMMTVIIGGCSKSDGESASIEADISVATGTYKGTLEIFPPQGSSQEFYDATVIVTKDGDNVLKITPRNSGTTSKYIQVTAHGSENSLVIVANGPSGILSYKHSTKEIILTTKRESATEVMFYFSGTKQ